MTSSKRPSLITTVVVIILVAIVGTVAIAMYAGIQAGRKSHATSSSSPQPQVALLPAAPGADAAPGSIAIQPYPIDGPFQPGPPPFAQSGVTGDGLSAWGVAFKEVSDPAAQLDADLIKSAYQDAQKKAASLASATGIKLGKLVAISDYGQNQPYYNKPCVQPYALPRGTGTPGPATNQGQVVPAGPPQAVPVPSPCQSQRYVVAWVLLRYQIQS